MSLILDALNKSEQERNSGSAQRDVPALPSEDTEGRRIWPRAVAGALALSVIGLAFFLWRPDAETPPPTAEQPPSEETGQARENKDDRLAETPRVQALTPSKQTPVTAPASGAKPQAQPETAKPAPQPIIPMLEPKPEIIAPEPKPEPEVAEPEPKPKPEPEPEVAEPEPEPEIAEVRIKPKPLPVLPPRKPKKPASAPISVPPPANVVRSDAWVYNMRGKAFEQEGLYDRAIVEYTQAILLDQGFAEAYLGRGWAQEAKGNHKQAIRNFTQAIRASSSYAEAYFGRGWAHEQLGQSDLAIEEYSKAIRAKPNYTDAFLSRGILRFYTDRLEGAANDFSRALDKADGSASPFALLWLYISRARSGGNGSPELVENARKINLETWPGVIVSLFMGNATPDQVVAGTKDTLKAREREKACVAFFFLGQYHLVRGEKNKAEEFFRKTLDTGVTGYRQYEAAIKELQIMKKLIINTK